MVHRAIDARRRTILRTVATGMGLTATGRPAMSSPSAERDNQGRTVSEPDGPGSPDFVVHPGEGTTRLSRRGDDGPVFEGPAGAAIQRAVDIGESSDAGALIAIASGTYELDRPVTLASSTWLTGGGSATALRAGAGFDTDLLRIPVGAEHVRVSDLRIEGNRNENGQESGIVVAGGAWRPVLEHLVVRNVAGHGIRFTGGPDGEYSYEPTLADIDVARCAGDGFVFGYTGDLFGVNLYAEACEGYGFTMADAGGTLVHPHAYDTKGEAGIRALESAKDLNLIGPHAEGNRRHGALIKGERIVVRNAFVANNSRDAPGSYSGLVLDGARDSTVSESTFVNDAERGRTQGHGIVETADSRDNVVAANLFRNHVTSAVDRPSRQIGSAYRHNRGYRTENGGETTVRDDGTIPHELDERPRQYWVHSTAPGVYAHIVDANQTDLVVEVLRLKPESDPGGDIRVAWEAKS
jgi:hypothetical protein